MVSIKIFFRISYIQRQLLKCMPKYTIKNEIVVKLPSYKHILYYRSQCQAKP